MWSYRNPVKIHFGTGELANVGSLIAGRRYCLVTYDEPVFDRLSDQIATSTGAPVVVVNDIQPNPDFSQLAESCRKYARSASTPEVIVALGGGSVIDAAKVLACAGGDFLRVEAYLKGEMDASALCPTPIIAISTTAGTGSEVTSWSTVWYAREGKKYSLNHPRLYPEAALVDPELTLMLPHSLTVSTGLDALSHALESLWNVNYNPISAEFAVSAACEIIDVLPVLVNQLDDIDLRSRMCRAALMAGMAFSNTKTAIAHNISYPITLRHNVPHGLACSFTLPQVLKSSIGANADCDRSLRAVFGNDLESGCEVLSNMLNRLEVSQDYADYGVDHDEWLQIVGMAFDGERGRNFIGAREQFVGG
jgi:alcohol dehydrogenase